MLSEQKELEMPAVDRSLFGKIAIPYLDMTEVMSRVNAQRYTKKAPPVSEDLKKWLLNLGTGFDSDQKDGKADVIQNFNKLDNLIKLKDKTGYQSSSVIAEVKSLVTRQQQLKMADIKELAEIDKRLTYLTIEPVRNYNTMASEKFWKTIQQNAIIVEYKELQHDGTIQDKTKNYSEYENASTLEEITQLKNTLKSQQGKINDYAQREEILTNLYHIIKIKKKWLAHGRFADYASEQLLAVYKFNIQPRKEQLDLLEDKLNENSELFKDNSDLYQASLQHVDQCRKELIVIEMQMLESMTARLEASEQFGHLQYDDLANAVFYKLPEIIGVTKRPFESVVKLYLGETTEKRRKLRSGMTPEIAKEFHVCLENAASEANSSIDKLKKKRLAATSDFNTIAEDVKKAWHDAFNIKTLLKKVNELDLFRAPNELKYEHKDDEDPACKRLLHNPAITYVMNTGAARLKHFTKDEEKARAEFTFENIDKNGCALWLELSRSWLKQAIDEFNSLKNNSPEMSAELKQVQDFIQDKLDNVSSAFNNLRKNEATFVLEKCSSAIKDMFTCDELKDAEIKKLQNNLARVKLFINEANGNSSDTYIQPLDVMEILAVEIYNKLTDDTYNEDFIARLLIILNRFHPDANEDGLDLIRYDQLKKTLSNVRKVYINVNLNFSLNPSPSLEPTLKNTSTFVSKILYLLRPKRLLSDDKLQLEAERRTDQNQSEWIEMPSGSEAKKIPTRFNRFYVKKNTQGIKADFFNPQRLAIIRKINIYGKFVISTSDEKKVELNEDFVLEAPMQAISALKLLINTEITAVRKDLKLLGFSDTLEAEKMSACCYKILTHKNAFKLQTAWIKTLTEKLLTLENAKIQIIDNALYAENIRDYILVDDEIDIAKLNEVALFIANYTTSTQLLEKQLALIGIVSEYIISETKELLQKYRDEADDAHFSPHIWSQLITFLEKNDEYYSVLKTLQAPIDDYLKNYDGASFTVASLLSTLFCHADPIYLDDNFNPIAIYGTKRIGFVIKNVYTRFKAADEEFFQKNKNNALLAREINAKVSEFINLKRAEKKWHQSTALFIEEYANDANIYAYRIIAVDAILSLSIDEKLAMKKVQIDSLITDIVQQARPDHSIPPLIPPEEKSAEELQQLIDKRINEPWNKVTDTIIDKFGTLAQKQNWNYTWISIALKMTSDEIKKLEEHGRYNPLTALHNKAINLSRDLFFKLYIDFFGLENLKKLYAQINDATIAYMKADIKPIDLDRFEQKTEIEPETESERISILQMSVTVNELYRLFSKREICGPLGLNTLSEKMLIHKTRILVSARNFNLVIKDFYANLKVDPEKAASILNDNHEIFSMTKRERDELTPRHRTDAKITGDYDYDYEESPDLFFTHYKQAIIKCCFKELEKLNLEFKMVLEKSIKIDSFANDLNIWTQGELTKEVTYLPIDLIDVYLKEIQEDDVTLSLLADHELDDFKRLDADMALIKNKLNDVSMAQSLKTAYQTLKLYIETILEAVKFKNYIKNLELLSQMYYYVQALFSAKSGTMKPHNTIRYAHQEDITDEQRNQWTNMLDELLNRYKLGQADKLRKEDSVYYNPEGMRYLINLLGTKEQQQDFYGVLCTDLIRAIGNSFALSNRILADELRLLSSNLKIFLPMNDGANASILNFFTQFANSEQKIELSKLMLKTFKERISATNDQDPALNQLRDITLSSLKLAFNLPDDAALLYLNVFETNERIKIKLTQNMPISKFEIETFVLNYKNLVPSTINKIEFTLNQAKYLWTHCSIRIGESPITTESRKAHEDMMHELIDFMLALPLKKENIETVKTMLGETTKRPAKAISPSNMFSSYLSSQMDYAVNRARLAIIINMIEKYVLEKSKKSAASNLNLFQNLFQPRDVEFKSYPDIVTELGLKEPRDVKKILMLLDIRDIAVDAIKTGQLDVVKNKIGAALADFPAHPELYLPQTKYLPTLQSLKDIIEKSTSDLCKEWSNTAKPSKFGFMHTSNLHAS